MTAASSLPLGHLAGGEWVPPGEALGHWSFDPVIVASLTALAAAYALLSLELRRTTALRPSHIACFWLGFATLAVALSPPAEALSTSLLSGHMAQHVLLVAVAAPLIAYGTPLARMGAAMPPGLRRRLPRLRALASAGAAALVVALVVHVATMWAWHVPALYEAALEHRGVHVLQHVTFLATALAVWWAVLDFGAATRPSGASVGALFVLGAQGAALGALLAFATSAWYATYVSLGPLAGVDPLADQQLAGLVMWGVGGIGPVLVGTLLLVAWLSRLDRFPRAAP